MLHLRCQDVTLKFIPLYFWSQAGDCKRQYSEMLATDEGSRAALISRVVQTSKQAARATGGWSEHVMRSRLIWAFRLGRVVTVSSPLCAAEVGPEEHLQSSEGQSHM